MAVPTRRTRDTEPDPVKDYLKEIGKIPLLNAEQEVELAIRIEAGKLAEALLEDETLSELTWDRVELAWVAEDGRRAKDEMLTANLRLVVSIAKRYGGNKLPLLDLIQEGNVGLVRAVEKFDFQKGFKFSTYATWWIRQAITRGIAMQARSVHLPVHLVEEINVMGRVERELMRDLGLNEVPVEKLAEKLDWTVEKVTDLKKVSQPVASLDTPLEEDFPMVDALIYESNEFDVIELAITNSGLKTMIGWLEPRTADVLRRRYGLHDGSYWTLANIGDVHGVSSERIRQIEREGLAILRREYAEAS